MNVAGAPLPTFAAAVDAERFCGRVRTVTTYMRVTRVTRKAERRRASLLRAAAEERKRLEAVARAGEAAARRDAVRREREGRVGGPSARTRECSTVPERERRRRGDGRDARRPAGATRRGPTHVSAQVGSVTLRLLEWRRPRHDPG